MNEDKRRVLRVIEYVGTEDFIRACIDRRQVKGTMIHPNGTIREAVLGDTPELLHVAPEIPLLGDVENIGREPK